MCRSEDAHPHDKKQHDVRPRSGVALNPYAAAKGLTESGPHEDAYMDRLVDLIAQRVSERVIAGLEPSKGSDCRANSLVARPEREERLLTDQEVAGLLKVSKQTIWRWTKTFEDFPKPFKIGKGSTRWRLSEVLEYEARSAGAR